MKFSDRLKQACERAGVEWSQTEIGRALGVKKQTAERWMGDGQPAATTLFAIADRLKVDPRWLATGEEQKAPRGEINLLDSERDLIARYRGADARWQLALRLLAALGSEQQVEFATDVNVIIARIIGKRPGEVRYASNERVAAAFGQAPQVKREREGK